MAGKSTPAVQESKRCVYYLYHVHADKLEEYLALTFAKEQSEGFKFSVQVRVQAHPSVSLDLTASALKAKDDWTYEFYVPQQQGLTDVRNPGPSLHD